MNVAALIAGAGLVLFLVVGLRAARGLAGDTDDFLTARASQDALRLGLSFFASGLGAWILFTPPEVGTFAGLGGILGYGLAAAAPFVALAWLGPRVRDALPRGVTLAGFARLRYGRAMQVYVGLVSVFYMFIFVTAELTAAGGAVQITAGVPPIVTMIAVASATLLYTAYGGLRASLRTDAWQAWAVLGLVVGFVLVAASGIDHPVDAISRVDGFRMTRVGWESMIVLLVAVTAANLFHQGYWQRTWSARSPASLRSGALLGAILTVPVVVVLGFAGAAAAGAGLVDDPSLALFSLLQGHGPWLGAMFGLLTVALVASSVDTLQNAMVALVVDEVGEGRVTLGWARWLTAILFLPSVMIALQGISVLRLFLVADLLAAATVGPVMLGLALPVSGGAALTGSVSGLAAVVALGWLRDGSLGAGLALLTLPSTASGGLDLGAFLVAPAASILVTVLLAARRTRRRDNLEMAPRRGDRVGPEGN